MNAPLLWNMVETLFVLSEARGKEASGIAFVNNDQIEVLKRNLIASKLIKSKEYNEIRQRVGQGVDRRQPLNNLALIGHARLVTNGSQNAHHNNQPVAIDGLVGVHNGIVVNVDELWAAHDDLQRMAEVDTEVLLAIYQKHISSTQSYHAAIKRTFKEITGAASVGILHADNDLLTLATNNGSLYYAGEDGNAFIFASERYILETLIKKFDLSKVLGFSTVYQLKPQNGVFVQTDKCILSPFNFDNQLNAEDELHVNRHRKEIIDHFNGEPDSLPVYSFGSSRGPDYILPKFKDIFQNVEASVSTLRRCTKCVLPETVPFIEFDEQGVCNYCNNYKRQQYNGHNGLLADLDRYISEGADYDCIVPLSGGRDSSYALHYLVKECGLKPIAYTYDWGMVTDLARRNISRMCGQLGVEHILVSANIRRKRENIRKNINAWLKRPVLGTVPLFMAGDKQFFYYVNQIKKQTKIKIDVWSVNPLERTDFKSGFCGVRPREKEGEFYNLALIQQIKMAYYYGKNFIINPGYLNTSIIDTIFSFASYYFIQHNLLLLYDYIEWVEETVNDVLLGKYDWETATDTDTTWRIGDATAPFYNYIYYVLAGFSENDTFRSNQIREGALSREKALELICRDNRPRYDSIKWYCDAVGIDFSSTITRINNEFIPFME